ncbi:borealin-like [Tachypleus tridentatus]|uniref:borealin-like n=1 Tax=Tachypleus tridentatus TaxID=6853 RepID=UPI003FCF723B
MPSKRKAKSYSRNKKSGGDSQTEERKIKISSFLEDFDSQVQIRINKTNSEMEKLCSAITFLYQREIMKLPKKLREMKFKDFVDQGGSVDSHCAKRVDKSIGEVTNNVTSVVSTISSETSTKSSKTEENPLPTKRKGQPLSQLPSLLKPRGSQGHHERP